VSHIAFDSQGNIRISGTGTATVIIQADNVGLAKASQLPSALTAAGNLRIAIQESITLPISGSVSATIATDNVGLAKASQFQAAVKVDMFNVAFAANTTTNSPAFSPGFAPSLLRIYIHATAAGTLSVIMTRGAATITVQGGVSIAAGGAGTLISHPTTLNTDSYVVRFVAGAAAGTITRLAVLEVPAWA
jgi:hypothetical protein